MIPLTKLQREIMEQFYARPPLKVIFGKKERKTLWDCVKARLEVPDFESLRQKCPALAHQIRKSYESGNNVQSAVFSECVYAQTFANVLRLGVFVNCSEDGEFIPENVRELLKSYCLFPRYVYSDPEKSKMLIQAGGCNGIDSALISVFDLNIYTIEFKEPGAKTSEPDLPKYGEQGNLLITDDFIEKYPQYRQMLEEQKELNFFAKMGGNENNFSFESVDLAVSNNYVKKYADVVCTEDKYGYLVMIPVNQLSVWGRIEGEIRPAGRNSSKVWTPTALSRFIKEKNGVVEGAKVMLPISAMGVRKERGGNGKISGYKINPLFFVRIEDCTVNNGIVEFDVNRVRQLCPTIAGKVFLKTLKYSEVKDYYFKQV